MPQWACPWNTRHSTQFHKINCYCRHKTLFSGKCKVVSNLKVTFGVNKQQTEETNSTGHHRKGEWWDLSLTLLFEPFRDASVREQYLKASCQTSIFTLAQCNNLFLVTIYNFQHMQKVTKACRTKCIAVTYFHSSGGSRFGIVTDPLQFTLTC